MGGIAEKTKLDRVYRHLHGEIVRGRFQSGERLPTEEELADRFGYSRTTVAKAIRMLARQGLVERRRRAGSFVRNGSVVHSQLVGAMICGAAEAEASSNIFVPISREIAHEAEQAGYRVMVHDPMPHLGDMGAVRMQIDRMMRQFIDRQVAGVLMSPIEIMGDVGHELSSQAAETLAEAGIPVVLLDRDLCPFPLRSRFDLVGIDNRRAGCVMAEHLLGMGLKRIDFVASDRQGWAQEARIAGYQDALRNAGIEPNPAWVHRGQPNLRMYVEGILSNKRIEAIIAVNDWTAGQVMQIAKEIGRRIPDELRIVGFDDLPTSQAFPTPLTTIRQPCADLGAMAIRTLFDRMRHPSRRTTDVTVSFELIVRESCGAKQAVR